jgi:hypothetical protein
MGGRGTRVGWRAANARSWRLGKRGRERMRGKREGLKKGKGKSNDKWVHSAVT